MADDAVLVVMGATGRQGGAVTRHLLADGRRVRAVTRDPGSKAAKALIAAGAEVVPADMSSPETLRDAFAEARGVFSVQNPMISGEEEEVAQGRNVADAAAEAGVAHVVYASAGPGTPGTGVSSWDNKLVVAEHARGIGLPLTVLRPTAFLELMTDKDLFPAVGVWHNMARIAGEDRPILWFSADDLGALAARAFADPTTYVGVELALTADVKTIAECREIWQRVTGGKPKRFPMPRWLFERFVGPDLIRMFRWIATHDFHPEIEETRAHLPDALTVEEFVRRHAGRAR